MYGTKNKKQMTLFIKRYHDTKGKMFIMCCSTYNGYVLNICNSHACLHELLHWLWRNRRDKGVFLSDIKQQSYIVSCFFTFLFAWRTGNVR